MGEALAKLARIRKQQQGGDDKGEDKLSDQEQRAYDKMLKEAIQNHFMILSPDKFTK